MFRNSRLIICSIIVLTSVSLDCLAITDITLDNRAKKLPYKDGLSTTEIVAKLTHNLKTDREKARVLAAFVAYQLQRNGFAERELKTASKRNNIVKKLPANNLLKTRIGTSQDFAALYQQLCDEADLEAVTITGYAGKHVQSPDKKAAPAVRAVRHSAKQLTGLADYRMQEYEASWNAVKLNDKWALIDTYWMIAGNATFGQDIRNYSKMESLLTQRERAGVKLNDLTRGKKIDNAYFDANPRQFIKTHYPIDNQWQLLPTPVSWQSFLK